MSNAKTALNELSALAALATLTAPTPVAPKAAVLDELAALAALPTSNVAPVSSDEAAYQAFMLNATAGTTVTITTGGKSVTLSF